MYNIHIPHIHYFNTVSICIVAPSIENSPENEIRDQTENVTLLCQAVGKPVPDISWYFNGVMINVSDNSSKYMIMSRSLNITTTENTLTVYNVTSLDVGAYTCNSTNFIGSAISSGILTVTSKLILLYTCSCTSAHKDTLYGGKLRRPEIWKICCKTPIDERKFGKSFHPQIKSFTTKLHCTF